MEVRLRTPIDIERLEHWYESVLQIRRVEEWISDAVIAGQIGGPCHLCIGQEAIPVGVAAALTPADYLWGTHRSHGHYLAKGGSLTSLLAELLGSPAGCTGGRGGSMHLMAPEVGILGTVPIVAGTIPLAAGAALACKRRGNGDVSVAFFGDGATEQGIFTETINLALLFALPVVFVCENNLYSSHLPIAHRQANPAIAERARSLGIPAVEVDGNDVEAVFDAATEAVNRARRGGGPSFIEAMTYRQRGHVGAGQDLHVGDTRAAELVEWLQRDPVVRLRAELLARGVSAEAVSTIETRVETTLAIAAREAAIAPPAHSQTSHASFDLRLGDPRRLSAVAPG